MPMSSRTISIGALGRSIIGSAGKHASASASLTHGSSGGWGGASQATSSRHKQAMLRMAHGACVLRSQEHLMQPYLERPFDQSVDELLHLGDLRGACLFDAAFENEL